MKLVAPVYSLSPMVDRIIEFKGLNRNPVIDDGEMRDMLNMSCDEYPCLTQRKPRGTFSEDTTAWSGMDVQNPVSIIQKGRIEDGANVKKLAVIDYVNGSYVFKYDGQSYPQLVLSEDTQMVAINTRICFFPEKKWFNVQTKEIGDMGCHLTATSMSMTSDGYYQMLTFDNLITETMATTPVGGGDHQSVVLANTPVAGSEITIEYVTHIGGGTQKWTINGFKRGTQASVNVQGGSIGYDGTQTFHLVMGDVPFSGMLAKAIYTTTNTTQITEIKEGDVVDIYARIVVGDETYDYSEVPVSCRVEKVEGYTIYILDGTLLEAAEAGQTNASLYDVEIKRECPDLEYVIEYNNRLWGVDNANNEIRASKQGDPTNWNYFQGESLDSYAATQGSDGQFTGAAAYSNHLLFFKEDCIHKVYGSKPSNYQIETATCHGLEKGSSKSVQIVNDTVFYKSRIGIMAYDGGSPFLVSEAFGQDVFKNVIAGSEGRKYYASMQKADGTYTLMVFDVSTGMWQVEDSARVTDFCYYNGKLLMIIDGVIMYANADSGEDNMAWMAEFGAFDEFVENKKIYSKIRMNLDMTAGSSLVVKIKEEDGNWETVKTIGTATEDSEETVVIVPRRCNRYSIQLSGTGRVRIKTLTRQYRLGTDRKDIK